jgi:hypothetical protein
MRKKLINVKFKNEFFRKLEDKLCMEIRRKLWSGFGRELSGKLRVNIKWIIGKVLWKVLNEKAD